MSLQDTPRSNRLHIGIFGKRNSGKSSLINALTNQDIAIVSDIAGTTTDPVYKSMEIHGIGPVVFIDTAGFDDIGEIGQLRISQTKKAMEKTDVAIMLFTEEVEEAELQWVEELKRRQIPVIAVINKIDVIKKPEELRHSVEEKYGIPAILVSALTKEGVEKIRQELIRALPADFENESITSNLVKPDDIVLLVMPQDIQAPKGRLILPQVQVIRELLDKKCIVISVTTDKLDAALNSLRQPPKLIITDSQVFKTVYEKKPEESMLTSFSVLLAGYKGDLGYFVEGAYTIGKLTENSRVLIAEACTHAPLEEDIGREKIPNMLRKRFGKGLRVDITAGTDFPEDLTVYDLIIHCGGCMFNRKYVLTRIERAKAAGVPMTNYGVVIAYLSGILDKIDLP
ncbi:MAG TPA: [FeFe] hydrogenase H-cluster maturation GTPase HydF [Negativicutes bacterium]|nr:[FeFe] hydrogenase H-cluster maturation GTPase HydF [Negativicutes bacterium]